MTILVGFAVKVLFLGFLNIFLSIIYLIVFHNESKKDYEFVYTWTLWDWYTYG